MSDFWSKFTYCVRIIEHYSDGSFKIKYVTSVDNLNKTFKFYTLEDIKEKNLKVEIFKKNIAIDLMNCITCNGFDAVISPYFN